MKKTINKNIIFIKYVFVSGFSFVFDIILFSIFSNIITGSGFIIYASFLARFISSLVNFILNKKTVFKSNEKNSIYKYFILAIINICISATLVNFMYPIFQQGQTIIKVVVDVILFILNYFIQKKYIFQKIGEKKEVNND